MNPYLYKLLYIFLTKLVIWKVPKFLNYSILHLDISRIDFNPEKSILLSIEQLGLPIVRFNNYLIFLIYTT